MTDPAPSPSAAPRPVPVRPMPRLGHGVHWPAIVAEIDEDEQVRQCAAEVISVPAEDLNPSAETTSAPGHRNGCQGCTADPGAIPLCWTAEDVSELRAAQGWPFRSLESVHAEAEQIYAELHEMHGDKPYLGPALPTFSGELSAPITDEQGTALIAALSGRPPGDGPPYEHRHVLPEEDDPPAPTYTVTSEAPEDTTPPYTSLDNWLRRYDPWHQHIWSITSPMRCVECRRYLRPWWRRALDRVRRWGR